MPVVQHRSRRLSTSSNTDDLHAEIDSLQAQLDTTQSNLGTLRGTNNRLNDRVQKLEAQLDDNAVHVQTQEKDINSLRRQLRISGAEITRLRTEREVLEKDYESVQKDVVREQEERRKLMEKIAELEEQVASALHLHVVSSNRVGSSGGNSDKKRPTSWLDLSAKLRETENELDAVQQERDWLEGQLEKFIHAKDALDSNFSIQNLRTRTSMTSIAESARSYTSSRRSSTSSHGLVNKQSLGQELGLEWNGEYDSDADSDGSGDSDSTERADNESEAENNLTVPRIVADDDTASVASSSKRSLKDFALRLDTSGRPYRGRSRAQSGASQRAPSIAASIRSRMSARSIRPGSRLSSLDDIPPPPVTATAVFHEIERQHDAKVSKLQNDIVTLSTDLQGEIEILQQEVNAAREERDVCVLEIQKLSTELSVANARHEDSIAALEARHVESVAALEARHEECITEVESRHKDSVMAIETRHQDSITALEAALAAAEAAKEQAKADLQVLPPLPAPVMEVPVVEEVKEVKEIGIQTDFYEPEPVSSARELLEPAVPEILEELTEVTEAPEEIIPEEQADAMTVIEVPAPAEAPVIPETPEPPVSHFTAALEAEIATLRDQEQLRLADNLKLKSEIDVLTRDLREKDTLLRAEVVRLESHLDELIRDNRNMKDDAEINHYKVENLADELDRTRELLQIQAGERREFMEEIEQLRARNRELELQMRIRLATPSPVPQEGPDERSAADMASFAFPLKDSSSAKSDFEDTLDRSDDEFALVSDSESDVPPPVPIQTKHKRRKSSSGKHKRHHSKREKRKEKEKEKERDREERVEITKDTPTPRKHSHSKQSSVSKIPTASKIPSATKSTRKSMTLPRSISAQLPPPPKSPKSPLTPPPEPRYEHESRESAHEQPRARPSTLALKIPRPSISFRGAQTPVEPPPDKTYWKDLMVGGYSMPPHEYNKHRRDMRNFHKNMQIKVTAKGVETKGRVGTGAGFGVGNYADEPELKPVSKKKIPKRRTSFSDDETYTHKERGGWLSGVFRK
ncbi:hypothetical protein TWF481_007118 [Arthrobotrys musiformis]|uniref:Uncharacterized protein n=1 Tax=Arthrobotrys musiformis TaxID=47236 RepID=A0AAV9WAH8_9PEZI